MVGMPVIPADKASGRQDASQVFARNGQRIVAVGTYRVEHGVIGRRQLRMIDVSADLHRPEKADALIVEGEAEETVDNLLLVRMVGRDPIAHKAPGIGQTIEDIDRRWHLLLLQKMFERIKSGWPRADDGDFSGCRPAHSAPSKCRRLTSV